MRKLKPQPYKRLHPNTLAIHPKHLARRLREAERNLPIAERILARLETPEARAEYPTQRGYNVALTGARNCASGWRGKLKIIQAIVNGDLVPVENVETGYIQQITRAEYVEAFGEAPPDLRTLVEARNRTVASGQVKTAATKRTRAEASRENGKLGAAHGAKGAEFGVLGAQYGVLGGRPKTYATPEKAAEAIRKTKRESARKRRALSGTEGQ